MQCAMHKEAVERAMRAESELEAVGAGGVQRLAIAPQPCSRSHPHEEMTPMCELRTEIARLTNALARAEAQLAAAPQAVQPLPEIKDMANSPQLLNMHDRAFWVLGWNECRDACKALAATYPTQQGLDAGSFEQSMSDWAHEDAQDAERFRKFAAVMLRQDPAFEEAIEAYPKPDFEIATIDDVRAMIDAGLAAVEAAQAKQGEQANG